MIIAQKRADVRRESIIPAVQPKFHHVNKKVYATVACKLRSIYSHQLLMLL
jgi:hypothetical protein